MPNAAFGEKLNFGGGQFAKLVGKGDKIRFRLAGSAVYEGRHFLKDPETDRFTVISCPRIMEKKPCGYCNIYFDMKRKAKEEADERERNQLEKEANDFRCTLSFYFPIIDREAGGAKVLKTTVGVRGKLEAFVEDGVDVMNSDFILTRTEQPGSDYYRLVRVDSTDTKELTEDEKTELAKAKLVSIEELLGHGTNQSHVLDETVDISPAEVEGSSEDMPF